MKLPSFQTFFIVIVYIAMACESAQKSTVHSPYKAAFSTVIIGAHIFSWVIYRPPLEIGITLACTRIPEHEIYH